MSLTCSHTLQ